jgi:hypothetical protein
MGWHDLSGWRWYVRSSLLWILLAATVEAAWVFAPP